LKSWSIEIMARHFTWDPRIENTTGDHSDGNGRLKQVATAPRRPSVPEDHLAIDDLDTGMAVSSRQEETKKA
jgi:hypothetical protein